MFDSSEIVAAAIHEHFRDRHLLLLSDFDGTLAELAPTPDEAVVSASVRSSLEAVARLPSVTVGVVSGRRIVDVADRVGPVAAFVAGLHGLEIVGPGCRFRHEALDSVRLIIDDIAVRARRDLVWCPGLYLEYKTFALACHVRMAPEDLGERALEAFKLMAAFEVSAHVLKLLSGAKVLELVPAVDWHKGSAAEWIRERVSRQTSAPVSILYLGDDRTDHDAFEVLGDGDVAVGVGDRPHMHLIDWCLAGPASVGRLFTELVRLSQGGSAEAR